VYAFQRAAIPYSIAVTYLWYRGSSSQLGQVLSTVLMTLPLKHTPSSMWWDYQPQSIFALSQIEFMVGPLWGCLPIEVSCWSFQYGPLLYLVSPKPVVFNSNHVRLGHMSRWCTSFVPWQLEHLNYLMMYILQVHEWTHGSWKGNNIFCIHCW